MLCCEILNGCCSFIWDEKNGWFDANSLAMDEIFMNGENILGEWQWRDVL